MTTTPRPDGEPGQDSGWLERQAKRTAEDIKELPTWLRSAPPASPVPAGLVEKLKEATTVLDEPFHHDAIAVTMLEAASALASLSTAHKEAVTRGDHLEAELFTARQLFQEKREEMQQCDADLKLASTAHEEVKAERDAAIAKLPTQAQIDSTVNVLSLYPATVAGIMAFLKKESEDQHQRAEAAEAQVESLKAENAKLKEQDALRTQSE